MMRALFALALVAIVGCPTPPNPPTPDVDGSAFDAAPEPLDAHRATACERACGNLASLACAEGAALNCAATCDHASGTLTDLHPACLAAAKTKAEARACRSVVCP